MSLEYRPEQRRLAVLSFTAKLQPRTRLGKMLLSHLKGNTKLHLASLVPHHHHHPRMLSAWALVTVGFASPAALPLPQQWLSWPQIVPSLECCFCWPYSFSSSDPGSYLGQLNLIGWVQTMCSCPCYKGGWKNTHLTLLAPQWERALLLIMTHKVVNSQAWGKGSRCWVSKQWQLPNKYLL